MLKESPQWPPPMPNPEALQVAKKMLFRHVREQLKDKAKTKMAKRLLTSLKSTDNNDITVDEFGETHDLVINITIQRSMRPNIESIFQGYGDMRFELEPQIVADVLNTLPEDADVQILADFLAGQFVEFRGDPSSSFVQIGDADHPEGRPLNNAAIVQMEEFADRQCDKMRTLYRAMLQRSITVAPPPSASDS